MEVETKLKFECENIKNENMWANEDGNLQVEVLSFWLPDSAISLIQNL